MRKHRELKKLPWKNINLGLPELILNAVTECAHEQDRARAWMIRDILMEGLAARGYWPESEDLAEDAKFGDY
ncbi:MAG: hypothetical protein V3U75_07495 [Methylococcaceae bacterium]